MKVLVEDAGPCRKIMRVEAPAEAIKEEYDSVVKAFGKAVRIPGFRKGKAPTGVVESRYAKEISENAQERLVPVLYQQALKESGLQAEAAVDVKDIVLDKNTGMTMTVTVDVRPDVKLPKYKKITVKEQSVAVSDRDVGEAVNATLDHFARYEEVKDRPCADGELVQIDYEGSCEDKPVAELSPDSPAFAKGEGFWMVLGGHSGIFPGIDPQIVGMSVDETRDCGVTFPDDHREKALAGKTVTYRVTVKAIREKIAPEINEELLQKLEAESEEAFRAKVRADLEQAAVARENTRQKDEIARYLLDKTDLDLPQAVLDRTTHNAARDMFRQMVQSGATRDQLMERQQDVLAAATRSSTDNLKLSYILTAIADAESIEVSEGDVQERIDSMARQYRVPPAQVRARLEEQNSLDDLRGDVRCVKALDFLLANAKLKKA